MFDATTIPDENLHEYDQMMVKMNPRVRRFAPSANALWAVVLRELDVRGQVQLLCGSYEDPGNAKTPPAPRTKGKKTRGKTA
jgi:hypothetical protein